MRIREWFGSWVSFLLGGLLVLGLFALAQSQPVLARIEPGARDGDDDLARELPRIPPSELPAALQKFQLHPGFRLETLAAEPLLTDPVAAVFDERGRLYVVEMRGYPYPENQPPGRVRLLEDADGDGRYEKSTIFLENLNWPTGIVASQGGVFVSAAPDLIYAKDTNGDGKADERRVAFTGFGTQNVQALLNGLLWGLDGWIYGAGGGNGGDIENKLKPGQPKVSVRGRDFRFKPDGSAFEAIPGGGQFGHCMDDWGHRFVCNNSNHIRQIVFPAGVLDRNPALLDAPVITDIAVEGGAGPVFRKSEAEPWRLVRTRQRAADPEMRRRLPPSELVPIGFFTSATGVTIYRGTAYPAEYRGNTFIGDVGGNLVHRKLLDRAGAVYSARRADAGVEFLTSRDNWFRPVNFVNTPFGTLLILDMYRETIEHPFSIPEPIKKHLDLTSGHDRGRLYHLLAESTPASDLATRIKSDFEALGSRDWNRVAKLLGHPDGWWRDTAQRLLVEAGSSAEGAVPELRKLLAAQPIPQARVHALWLLDTLNALRPEDLLMCADDSEPGVREQVARLAPRFADSSSPMFDQLLKLAGDPDPMVRFQTAIALGGSSRPEAVAGLATIARRDLGDTWTRFAVQSGLKGRAWPFLVELANKKVDFVSSPGHAWFEQLVTLIGTSNQKDAIDQVLEKYTAADQPPSLAASAVTSLELGLSRVSRSLKSHLGGSFSRLQPLIDQALKVAAGDGSLGDRVESIRLLRLGDAQRLVAPLSDLLDARQPVPVQVAAIQTLGRFDRDAGIGPILEHWMALSPNAKREAAEVVFARVGRMDALLKEVESRRIPPSEIEFARRKQMLGSTDSKIRERAERVLGADPGSDRNRVIARYQASGVSTGDPSKGRLVFQQQCSTCHQAEGKGQEVGPNLATVAARAPEELLVHILDPNREVAPTYLNYTVATSDGRVLSGILVEETSRALTLKRAEGAIDVVPRDQIEAVKSSGLSIMPEGVEKLIDPAAMADLIAFLRSLQAK